MIALLAITTGILLGLASGGRLGRLSRAEPSGIQFWLIGLFVLQALARSGRLAISSDAGVLLWATTTAMLFLAVLLHGSPLLAVAGAGMGMNVLVVVLNSGMPFRVPDAWPAAWRHGLEVGGMGFYMAVDGRTILPHLGDVLPTPLPSLVSMGDVLLGVGIACFVAKLMCADR